MKKSKKIVTALAILSCGFVLASCNNREVPPQECPECPVIVVDFKVNTTLGTGSSIEFENSSEKYTAGSTLKFVVNTTERYELTEVLLDGKTLTKREDGFYSFVMPNKDVNIETKTIELGDESIVNVTEFTKENLPAVTDITCLKTVIEDGLKANVKYLKEATFKTTNSDTSSYDDLYDYQISVGYNDVINVDGTKNVYGSKVNLPYHKQSYIENGYFYERESTVINDNYSTELQISKIVEESPSSEEITSEEAKNNVTSFDFYSILKEEYLDSYNYSWSNAKFSSKVSSDKKVATVSVNLVEKDSYYNKTTITTLDVNFDGDKFLRSINVNSSSYNNSDVDENNNLKQEAVALSKQTLDYNATRGYRKHIQLLEKTEDYLMNDYDVIITSLFNGNKTTLINGGEVYGNSILDFSFACKDNDKFLISPKFIGFKEGEEGFLGEFSNEVVKLGKFHLLFDNGRGDIKTVELNAVEPPVTSLNATVSSTKTFVDTVVTVDLSSAPSTASQEVTLTKKEGSVDCEINHVEGGKYEVKATTLGKIILEASSVTNPEIKKEIVIEVISKPNYEEIYNIITTKTLEQIVSGYGEPYYINFNDDGTGKLIKKEYDSYVYDYVEKYSTFKYTLDKDTLDFVITMDEGGQLSDALVDVTALSNESFTADIDLGYSVKTYDFKVVYRRA